MSRRHRLEQLLRHPGVWKAGQDGSRRRVLPTGFPELDVALSGGWPVGRLIELLVEPYGIGELRLLMPALLARAGKCGANRWIILVAPPYIPYAPAFAAQGLNLSRLLVARCRRQADILWAVEQALQSTTCAAVLAWSDGGDDRALRRLQLAAETDGSCLFVLFRPARLGRQRSPATLRLRLRAGAGGALDLDIFKNQGGRPQSVSVRMRCRTPVG